MSSEHTDRQTATPTDTPAQALSVPRWAVIAVTLIVLLPVLLMSSMMLMMGLIGPPMHDGMAAAGRGLVSVVGVISFLLVLIAIYGVHRLYAADMQ